MGVCRCHASPCDSSLVIRVSLTDGAWSKLVARALLALVMSRGAVLGGAARREASACVGMHVQVRVSVIPRVNGRAMCVFRGDKGSPAAQMRRRPRRTGGGGVRRGRWPRGAASCPQRWAQRAANPSEVCVCVGGGGGVGEGVGLCVVVCVCDSLARQARSHPLPRHPH